MDILLESILIEEAIETPYRKSSEKISKNVYLTGQTVMNSIRKLKDISNHAAPVKKLILKLSFCTKLKDHVSLQREHLPNLISK